MENRNWRVERNAPTLTGLRNDSFVPDGQITETTRRLNDGHYMMQYPGAVVKSLPGTLDATQSGTVDRPRGRTVEKARTGVSYQTAPAFSLPLINEREENYREVDSKVHGRLSIIEHQINDSTLQTFQSSNRKSSMGQNKSSIKDVDEGLSSRDSKSRRNMVSQCQLNSPQTAQSPLGGKQKIQKTQPLPPPTTITTTTTTTKKHTLAEELDAERRRDSQSNYIYSRADSFYGNRVSSSLSLDRWSVVLSSSKSIKEEDENLSQSDSALHTALYRRQKEESLQGKNQEEKGYPYSLLLMNRLSSQKSFGSAELNGVEYNSYNKVVVNNKNKSLPDQKKSKLMENKTVSLPLTNKSPYDKIDTETKSKNIMPVSSDVLFVKNTDNGLFASGKNSADSYTKGFVASLPDSDDMSSTKDFSSLSRFMAIDEKDKRQKHNQNSRFDFGNQPSNYFGFSRTLERGDSKETFDPYSFVADDSSSLSSSINSEILDSWTADQMLPVSYKQSSFEKKMEKVDAKFKELFREPDLVEAPIRKTRNKSNMFYFPPESS